MSLRKLSRNRSTTNPCTSGEIHERSGGEGEYPGLQEKRQDERKPLGGSGGEFRTLRMRGVEGTAQNEIESAPANVR